MKCRRGTLTLSDAFWVISRGVDTKERKAEEIEREGYAKSGYTVNIRTPAAYVRIETRTGITLLNGVISR